MKDNRFYRIAYDLVAALISFTAAFVTRLAVEYLFQLETEGPGFRERYISFFLAGVPAFVLIVYLSFRAAGFYKTTGSDADNWKPLRVISGIMLVPVIWSLMMYYLFPHPIFPRGVTLISALYLFLLAGVPRLAKHYIAQELVIHVDSHNKNKLKRILVIGGSGYIGSQLCRDLLLKGYVVRNLDSNIFGDFAIRDLYTNLNFRLYEGDFRNVETVLNAMRGVDAVVHLGGIVGDPACSLDDDFTTDINLSATLMLAEVAKVLKISRFIFASTCSVYGEGKESILSETSPLNPVSLYARTKIASEQALFGLANDNFRPTILRFGTLFGISPRPRFDLFVNLLTAKAEREGKMTVFGGNQWRPFVHVRDVSKALVTILEAPLSKVGGEIFNIGSNELNCQLIEVARQINKMIPNSELAVQEDQDDRRDYRVSFKKFEKVLGTKLGITIEEGIKELLAALRSSTIEDHLDPRFSNYKQTQLILHNGESSSALEVSRTPQEMLKKAVGT